MWRHVTDYVFCAFLAEYAMNFELSQVFYAFSEREHFMKN